MIHLDELSTASFIIFSDLVRLLLKKIAFVFRLLFLIIIVVVVMFY